MWALWSSLESFQTCTCIIQLYTCIIKQTLRPSIHSILLYKHEFVGIGGFVNVAIGVCNLAIILSISEESISSSTFPPLYLSELIKYDILLKGKLLNSICIT